VRPEAEKRAVFFTAKNGKSRLTPGFNIVALCYLFLKCIRFFLVFFKGSNFFFHFKKYDYLQSTDKIVVYSRHMQTHEMLLGRHGQFLFLIGVNKKKIQMVVFDCCVCVFIPGKCRGHSELAFRTILRRAA
jgi:hypothetical protein